MYEIVSLPTTRRMRGLAVYIIFFIFFLGGGSIIYFLNRISTPASSSSDVVLFTIEEGQGVNEISRNLKSEGLIVDSYTFEMYLWLRRFESKLQAGEYALPKNANAIQLTSQIIKGVGASNETVIKIPEGWTAQDIANYLDTEKHVVSKDRFLAAARVTDSRAILPDATFDFLESKPSAVDLEGYLFPDTYRIYKDADSADILEKMLMNFGQKLTPDLRKDIEKSGMTLHEVLTLASIVQNEVQTAEDMKFAAGIFLKRLEMGKPLESDATVNYITKKGTTRPSLDDLQTNSPYNTYKNAGLPPGPICNPGLQAIEAVVRPRTSPYLYFLTTPDGRVIYSETFEEHLANKRRFYP